MHPLGPAPLVIPFVVMLVAGWLVRRVAEAWFDYAPVITWTQTGLLALMAGAVSGLAWSTYRSLQVRRHHLTPQLAFNRLIFARAIAIAGAVIAGGYLGYGVSWLGVATDAAHERLQLSLLAALSGAIMVAAGLVMERACRVREDDSES